MDPWYIPPSYDKKTGYTSAFQGMNSLLGSSGMSQENAAAMLGWDKVNPLKYMASAQFRANPSQSLYLMSQYGLGDFQLPDWAKVDMGASTPGTGTGGGSTGGGAGTGGTGSQAGWTFPQYTQSWAFTPPDPYSPPMPPPFDPKKYGTGSTKK